VFISSNFIAGVEHLAAFSLGWVANLGDYVYVITLVSGWVVFVLVFCPFFSGFTVLIDRMLMNTVNPGLFLGVGGYKFARVKIPCERWSRERSEADRGAG